MHQANMHHDDQQNQDDDTNAEVGAEVDAEVDTEMEAGEQTVEADDASHAEAAQPDEAQAADIEAEAPSAEDKIAALNDQLLRTLAELENTRKRAERDRGEALKYGAMSFARDMLGVVDNLQRALKAAAEMSDGADNGLPEATQTLLDGVAATERDLLAALGRHKVTALAPMGEKFDPNIHEAMFEAPGTGQDSGTIIDVIEAGYMMEEKLLRPAKVGIAKD